MKKKKFINKTFDLVTKNAFDLVPNLTETFDLLKRSSEIRSSDQLPQISCPCICMHKFYGWRSLLCDPNPFLVNISCWNINYLL